MKAFTHEELERLLDHPDLQLRTMFLLGYEHGMRVSEICGLLRADVDLKARTVIVRRKKNSLTTTQPLSSEAWEALSELIRTDPISDYVFPSSKPPHVAYTRQTFWKKFRKAVLYAGLPSDKAHPHVLKHTRGISLRQAGVGVAEIQRYLGHKAISNTIIYIAPTDEEVGNIVTQAIAKSQWKRDKKQ